MIYDFTREPKPSDSYLMAFSMMLWWNKAGPTWNIKIIILSRSRYAHFFQFYALENCPIIRAWASVCFFWFTRYKRKKQTTCFMHIFKLTISDNRIDNYKTWQPKNFALPDIRLLSFSYETEKRFSINVITNQTFIAEYCPKQLSSYWVLACWKKIIFN